MISVFHLDALHHFGRFAIGTDRHLDFILEILMPKKGEK